MVDNKPPPRPDLIVQSGDRFFRRWRVLNHTQADNDIELLWSERQLPYVGLRNSMHVGYRKRLGVCVHGAAQIDGCDECSLIQKNLGKPPCPAAAFEDELARHSYFS